MVDDQNQTKKESRLIPEFVTDAKETAGGRAGEYYAEPRVRQVVEHEGFIIGYSGAEFGANWARQKIEKLLDESILFYDGLTARELVAFIKDQIETEFKNVDT